MRYLSADTHPDHDTICTFRRENFDAVAACFVMNVLISAHAEAKQLRRKHDFRPCPTDAKKAPKIRSAFVLEMKEKMERAESRAKYRLRKQTVEPVFGTIKKWMGFTQFLLRGHDNVSGEWQLVTLAYNMKRLWRMQSAQNEGI